LEDPGRLAKQNLGEISADSRIFVLRRCRAPTVAARMDGSLVLWLICDGKPGHENQSLGLAEAICRKVAGEIHRIDIVGAGGPLGRCRAAAALSAGLPRPGLILAAGHATHLPLLWLARRQRAKSVVLMKPSLPLSWFDLCIAPEHDFPTGCAGSNLILTRGALNRIRPGDGEKTGKLILIGGPSKTHGSDVETLLEMLAQATDRGGWELTDSRRTPEDFLDQARRRLPGVSAISHQETPPGWVSQKLRMAKEVWVTEDSVSMIYEALTSGARVGLLPMPRLAADARVLRGIDGLVADGFLTPFDRWRAAGRLDPPPEPLDEAGRCARLVVAKFGLADPSRGLH
jgi:mitochondrial fission protein ELM1